MIPTRALGGWKRVIYRRRGPRTRMQEPTRDRRPSAIVMFLKANWKWLLIVIAAAVFIMMVASD